MIYRREYMEQLKLFKENKIIKVITGLRRSGKYTLLQMYCDELISNGIEKEQIQFIIFELMKYDNIRSYNQLYDLITQNIVPNKQNYLFLDEIQQVANGIKIVNPIDFLLS